MALPRPFRGVLSGTGLGGLVLLESAAAGNMHNVEATVQQERLRQFILCPSR